MSAGDPLARCSRGCVWDSWPLLALALLLGGCSQEAPAPTVDATAHAEEVREWREWRRQRLEDPEGWLSLVGLAWLEPGTSTLGADPTADVRFPETAPARLGWLQLDEGRILFEPEEGVAVLHGQEPLTETLELATDRSPEPSVLAWESLRFQVIERMGRHAVRIRDLESPLLEELGELEYFPVATDWRIEARFEPYDPPRTIAVPEIFGEVHEEPSPGAVVFRRQGIEVRLDALPASDGRLFLIFGDATNGASTYGGGRYLYTDPPRDGSVVVDFNQAYSPPCIFTPYATCPLPPRQNRFDFAIEAGEKTWSRELGPGRGS